MVLRRLIGALLAAFALLALALALASRGADPRAETTWLDLEAAWPFADAYHLPQFRLDSRDPGLVDHLDDRWRPLEPGVRGIRSAGPVAGLRIWSTPAAGRLRLELEPEWRAAAGDRAVRLRINGTVVAEIAPTDVVRHEVAVAASLLRDGANDLEIECRGAATFLLRDLDVVPEAPAPAETPWIALGSRAAAGAVRQVPGARLEYCLVLPPGAALAFDGGDSRAGSARRRVAVRADGVAPQVLYEERAFRAPDARIDLGSFAGRPACLSFEVEAGGDERGPTDWSRPRVVAPGPAPVPSPSRPERPPNVVLYVIDTLRADHLGAYGYARETAPRISDFARGAVTFERAYAHSVWTKPSVGSLLTGLLPEEHGATNDVASLSVGVPQLATRLHRAGYATVGFQVNGNVGRVYGFDKDYDYFEGSPDIWEGADRNEVSAVGSWYVHGKIEAHAARLREPFFLLVQTGDPHDPYVPRGEFRRFVEGDPLGLLSFGEVWARWTASVSQPDSPERRALQAHVEGLYDGEILHTDVYFGKLLDLLRSRGVYDRTAVLLTADHGEALADHGPEFGHGHFHEHDIHVPLIFKPPHWEKAVRVAAPVQHIDVVPTVLQMAGLGAERLPGRSLLETLADPAPAPRVVHVMRARDEAIPRFPWAGRAVLQGGWKLIQDNVHQPRYELYDLSADPRERVDLWRPDGAAAPVAFRALLQALRARRPAYGAGRSGVLSAEEEEELRALGYVK